MAMPSINVEENIADSNAATKPIDESSHHTLYYYNSTDNIYLASIPQ